MSKKVLLDESKELIDSYLDEARDFCQQFYTDSDCYYSGGYQDLKILVNKLNIILNRIQELETAIPEGTRMLLEELWKTNKY